MPQDGSNNYQYPPGTLGIPDQTIESESYNTFINDLITNDLNIPRPIHRGGTGANTASGALVALGGEQALQLVSNYDSHVFVNGSFQSNPGATAAPEPTQYYTGIAYFHGSSGYIEARPIVGGVASPASKYVRAKSGTGWGPWVIDASDKVSKAGDTMSGDLKIVTNKTSGALVELHDQIAGGEQWQVVSSGGDHGTVGDLCFWNVTGGLRLNIQKNGGVVNQGGNFSVGSVFSGYGTPSVGTYYFGSDGTKYLTCDGVAFTLAGGDLFSSNGVVLRKNDYAVNIYAPTGGNARVRTEVEGAGRAYSFGAVGSNWMLADETAGVGRLTLDSSGNFSFNGAASFLATMSVSGNLAANDVYLSRSSAPNTGVLYMGNTGAKYLYFDGTQFSFAGAPVSIVEPTAAYHAASKNYVDSALAGGVVALPIAGGTMTGPIISAPSLGTIAAAATEQTVGIRGGGGAGDASYLTFHRPGVFAAALGIDTDNQLKYGGWSNGAVSYRVWHEGNLSPTSFAPAAGAGITVTGSTVSINTNNYEGVGSYIFAYLSGGFFPNVPANTTVAGSSLVRNPVTVGGSPPGTWRSVNALLNAGESGLFIRTA